MAGQSCAIGLSVESGKLLEGIEEFCGDIGTWSSVRGLKPNVRATLSWNRIFPGFLNNYHSKKIVSPKENHSGDAARVQIGCLSLLASGLPVLAHLFSLFLSSHREIWNLPGIVDGIEKTGEVPPVSCGRI
jgi:hypothetical protein